MSQNGCIEEECPDGGLSRNCPVAPASRRDSGKSPRVPGLSPELWGKAPEICHPGRISAGCESAFKICLPDRKWISGSEFGRNLTGKRSHRFLPSGRHLRSAGLADVDAFPNKIRSKPDPEVRLPTRNALLDIRPHDGRTT